MEMCEIEVAIKEEEIWSRARPEAQYKRKKFGDVWNWRLKWHKEIHTHNKSDFNQKLPLYVLINIIILESYIILNYYDIMNNITEEINNITKKMNGIVKSIINFINKMNSIIE